MKQYYTLEMLEDLYRYQEPNLSNNVIEEKAKNLKSVLNTLDISWARSNRRFYINNQLHTFTQKFN